MSQIASASSAFKIALKTRASAGNFWTQLFSLLLQMLRQLFQPLTSSSAPTITTTTAATATTTTSSRKADLVKPKATEEEIARVELLYQLLVQQHLRQRLAKTRRQLRFYEEKEEEEKKVEEQATPQLISRATK